MVKIKNNETIDDLLIADLKIIQKRIGFRFSLDAVLLAHFSTVKNDNNIMDLGTGTGIIPLILTTRAKSLKITGIEIQDEIANMASRSINLNNLGKDIEIINGDFRKLGREYNDKYDVVVANPPYWPVNEGKISSIQEIAISRHELYCSLNDLIKTASCILKSNGRFSMIHRSVRLAQIIVALKQHNLEPRRIQLVHPQKRKDANLVLVEAVKGAREGLKVLKPLVIYKENGSYSEDILSFYGEVESGDF